MNEFFRKYGMLLTVAVLVLAGWACTTTQVSQITDGGNSPSVQAQVVELSEEAQEIITEPTPMPEPRVDRNVFQSSIGSVFHDAVSWWNSDTSRDGDIEDDIDQLVSVLMSKQRWCDEVTCDWPGPEGHPESEGHEIAVDALSSLSQPVYPQDRFVNKFVELLEDERISLENQGILP